MNNIIVYCETNGNAVAEVSLELVTKAHSLANVLKVEVEGILIGNDLKGLEKELFAHGASIVHKAEDSRMEFYQTLPHASIVCEIMKKQQPQIGLFGASPVGRDLAPRIASALKSGLTADCTSLEIGEHYEKKTDTTYENLLLQIRPAFGGNIVATIINPDTRPQLATVREGVMKK